MPSALTASALQALKAVSTATLTTLLFKRGLRNTFLQGVRLLGTCRRQHGRRRPHAALHPGAGRPGRHLGVFQDHSHPQRKAVEELCPGMCW